MYTYITKELPMIIKANFPAVDATRAGIFGHSMGGMGALQVRYLPFSSLEIWLYLYIIVISVSIER